MDIVELYVTIDDFCKKFMPRYKKLLKNKKLLCRDRSSMLTTSEIVLIILLFTQSGYKCFKWYYINEVLSGEYKSYFNVLPSYNRFVELMPRSMNVLFRFMKYLMPKVRQKENNIEYIDSTKIPVCHNKRTSSNKVFAGLATIGKSSMGWFWGFKLHFTCDTQGNITNLVVTNANFDDRKPVLALAKGFKGKLFGDKGYLDKKMSANLAELGITLFTPYKKNMKARFLPACLTDIIYSKKHALIESVINIMKNKLQLCHTRHRSWRNFVVYIAATLLGYQLLTKKPKLNLTDIRDAANLDLNYNIAQVF